MAPNPSTTIDVDGLPVRLSSPDRVVFPHTGATKLDLVEYYLAVGPGALRGVRSRPTVLKRYPNGAGTEPFFQKRVPGSRPDWLQTATVAFPSGRTAVELCPSDVAHIIWAVNLGCLDLNPWAVRRFDLEHPDEMRIDLDPQPNVAFSAVRDVAMLVREVLGEHRLVGFPKTSGSRGIHVNVRIVAKWDFLAVRRACLALGREVERRRPDLATTAWWKEERGERVFLDYNQNARDRTVASAYSVRDTPNAQVSCPVSWDELPEVELADFTMDTVVQRFTAGVDPDAGIDDEVGSLASLLDLARRDEEGGVGDAPWPPNFAKQPTEPPRVQPSRRRPDRAEPS